MSFYKEVPGRQTTLESTLKFDTTPTEGSTNPVTSDGVKSVIDGAVGDASAALQEQIDEIAEKAGSGYIPKGEASVATLNALSGQENGELYTMTDSGTLTDGSLAVSAGDTVAWDEANSVWYKAMDYAPRQYGTNEVHNLATAITAFRTGDVIPVDGPSGTAKMSKDNLLKEDAQNALAENVAPAFNSAADYNIGDPVVHEGKNYTFINNHSAGAWNASDVIQTSVVDFVKNIVYKLTSLNSFEIATGSDLLDFSDENGNVFSFYDSNGVFHALLVDDVPEGDLLDICDANGYVIAYFDEKGFFCANVDFLVDNCCRDLLDFCDADGNTFAFWDENGYLHSKRVSNAELMLPDQINSWNSDILQIFKYPATLEEYFGVNAINFYIKTNNNRVRKCGKDLRRYFECTGLSSGTYKIGANIVDRNFNVIAEKEITLSVLSPTSPLTMKNILLIGDSETEGITNNSGISVAQGASEEGTFSYANELKRLLTTSTSPDGFPTGLNLSNVQLIGTRNTSDGRHEGYGGKDVNFFLGTTSPFYVGGKIDFNAYLAQDSVYGDTSNKGVDVIYILLGANVGNSVSVDENGRIIYDSSAYKTQMIPLIEKIKEQLVDDSSAVYYSPNLKIVLLSYVFPWVDGFGYHPYGSNEFTDGILNARNYIAYKFVNDELAETYGPLVESVMVSQMVDSENCYAYIEKKKNAYSSETELAHIEAVHPNRNGYRLYAQAVARDFVGRI